MVSWEWRATPGYAMLEVVHHEIAASVLEGEPCMKIITLPHVPDYEEREQLRRAPIDGVTILLKSVPTYSERAALEKISNLVETKVFLEYVPDHLEAMEIQSLRVPYSLAIHLTRAPSFEDRSALNKLSRRMLMICLDHTPDYHERESLQKIPQPVEVMILLGHVPGYEERRALEKLRCDFSLNLVFSHAPTHDEVEAMKKIPCEYHIVSSEAEAHQRFFQKWNVGEFSVNEGS